MKPEGIYTGMPMLDYVNDPAPAPSINASLAHLIMTKSARHAQYAHPKTSPCYEPDESDEQTKGSIAHALLLEGSDDKVLVIQAENWRTKAAQLARDEARAAGKHPILAPDYEDIRAMVSVARETIKSSELAEDFALGVSEETLIWQDAPGSPGLWARCRLDRRAPDWRLVMDYKSTSQSAEPKAWSKGALLRHGCDIQAAMIMRGVEHFHGITPLVVFIVQEMVRPFAVSLVALDPQWIALANWKLTAAMSIWRGALRTGVFPSYAARVAHVEPPPYAVNEWEGGMPDIDAEDIV